MTFAQLVERFAAAAAAGDGDALADLFTPGGHLRRLLLRTVQRPRRRSSRCWRILPREGATFAGNFTILCLRGQTGYASYRFSFESTRPEAKGARVAFDGIGRFDLEGDRIKRYSEVFDRGMALAQQAFEPERLVKIALKYANALKNRPEWAGHAK